MGDGTRESFKFSSNFHIKMQSNTIHNHTEATLKYLLTTYSMLGRVPLGQAEAPTQLLLCRVPPQEGDSWIHTDHYSRVCCSHTSEHRMTQEYQVSAWEWSQLCTPNMGNVSAAGDQMKDRSVCPGKGEK